MSVYALLIKRLKRELLTDRSLYYKDRYCIDEIENIPAYYGCYRCPDVWTRCIFTCRTN